MKTRQSIKIYDCIIVGGGPAGLTAAIYLKRFNRNILLIDKGEQRVNWAPKIRNLIGYRQGISGKILLKRLQAQAKKFKVETINGDAQIYRDKKGFKVQTNKQIYLSRFVIVATGMKDIQPPGIECMNLCHQGVLAYCPICDGFEHIDKKIGLLIGSKAGFKKINFFYGISRNLHVILIKNIPISAKHKKRMQDLNVKFRKGNIQNLKLDSKRKLSVKMASIKPFKLDTLYVELGVKVPHKAIRHIHGLKKNKDGRFVISAHQETTIPRLYAVGDCANTLAQVSVAVGEAAIAATQVHNRLREN